MRSGGGWDTDTKSDGGVGIIHPWQNSTGHQLATTMNDLMGCTLHRLVHWRGAWASLRQGESRLQQASQAQCRQWDS